MANSRECYLSHGTNAGRVCAAIVDSILGGHSNPFEVVMVDSTLVKEEVDKPKGFKVVSELIVGMVEVPYLIRATIAEAKRDLEYIKVQYWDDDSSQNISVSPVCLQFNTYMTTAWATVVLQENESKVCPLQVYQRVLD
jgi:hypothetical protein